MKGNRIGSVITRTSWVFTLGALTSALDTKLCTIPASVLNPGAYKVRLIVLTASDAATTDVVRIGTTSGGTEILNDVSVKAAAQTNYTGATDFLVVEADTVLYIRQTVTGAKTVGRFIVIVEPFELNVAALSNQEA